MRKDDFERLNLREDGGKERTIERSHAPERGLPTRELPDNEARRAVEARHVYHVDREQEAALRAVRDGVPEPGRVTDNLIRDGFAREEERGVRMTRTGERVLRRVERARSTDDSRGGLTRVQLDARYELSAAQQRALSDLGSFHIAREDAISRNIYDDTQRASAQIDELKANGLLQELRLRDQRDITYLALTPAGRDVVAKAHHDASHIHTGIARPSQARHDAAVYDAYQHAERAIRADGGTVRRIQLEGDLKAEIRREAYISAAKSLREQGLDIAAVTDPERNLAIREATVPIARSHGLPVDDDGAVIYPDMQLEIDRPDGTVGRCNVEVITEHYSAASVAAKQSAGFQLYLPQASSGARSGGGGVPVQPLAEELLDF